MGWLFTHGSTRREQIAERTRSWEHTTPEGVVVKSTCLRHCYRGGVFSGVLWSVWERTFTKDGQTVKPGEWWIACDLLRYQTGYGWGYKDMEEAMGPCEVSCPLCYLEMVPVACENWRIGVRAYHERQKAKQQARRAAMSA